MNSRSRSRLWIGLAVLAVVAIAAPLLLVGETRAGRRASGGWTQWGGSGQDFHAEDSKGLASEWPESGPRQLWSRELGDGYSAVLVDGSRLYTMHRQDDQEVVVCLAAKNGETLWEYRYAAAPDENHVTQFGEGPRSTPLIAGNRIYTIGVSGKMHCLDKKTGKQIWSRDLWTDHGGSVLPHGYSSSPIEYGDNVIALVGGEDSSVIAFDKKDGSVAWKSQSFKNSYSTPRLLEVDGETQLVTFMAGEIVGMDPDNGELRWQYAHTNAWGQNISLPVMADRQLIFFSSPEAGAKGLRLKRNGDTTEIEEVWSTRKIQFYHVTTVKQGDYVYGVTGTRAPNFMAALNIKTGKIAWRERGFAKGNTVLADGRLIILDEDGNLILATATPDKLTVHSKTQLFDGVAWTVPTVVGTTLYVRDKSKIVALDLG